MWLLAQVVPIILRKLVTTDSHHWECFSSLLEIMGVAFSMCIFAKNDHVFEKCNQESLVTLQECIPWFTQYTQTTLCCAHSKSDFEVWPSNQKLVYAFWGKACILQRPGKKIKNFKNIPYLLGQKNQKVVCTEHMNIDGEGKVSPLFSHKIALSKNKSLSGGDSNFSNNW